MNRVSVLLAGVAFAATASSAMAADAIIYEPTPAPVSAVYDWTGAYVGAHLGYAWGDARFVDVDGYNNLNESFSFDPDGFLGGVQAGYNWQSGGLVLGAEVELGYLNLDGSRTQPLSPGGDTYAAVDGGVYAGLSARLGYAFDRTLVYAKAGGVYSGGEFQVVDNCNTGACGPLLASGSERIGLGYQLGAGVEHAVTDQWSVKLEYAYFDFGKETVAILDSTGGLWDYRADLSAHTLKIGFNYKF